MRGSKIRKVLPRLETPWGVSDSYRVYDEGILFISTPSHGGFRVDAELYRQAAAQGNLPLKPGFWEEGNQYVWFEEDSEWAFVAITFPDKFTSREKEIAESTIRENYPDVWEKWKARQLQPGESWRRDLEIFRQLHANEMQVVAAVGMPCNPAVCLVYACRGGRLENGMYAGEVKTFLVSTERYGSRMRNPAGIYIIQPGDVEISDSVAKQIKAVFSEQLAANPDAFVPTGEVKDIGENKLLLVCRRSSAGEDRPLNFEIPISAEEWNLRDLSRLIFVNEDGSLYEAPQISEETEGDTPMP